MKSNIVPIESTDKITKIKKEPTLSTPYKLSIKAMMII